MGKRKIKTFLVMVSAVFLSLFLFTDSACVEEKVNINDLDQLSIDLITEAEYNLNDFVVYSIDNGFQFICYALKKRFL